MILQLRESPFDLISGSLRVAIFTANPSAFAEEHMWHAFAKTVATEGGCAPELKHSAYIDIEPDDFIKMDNFESVPGVSFLPPQNFGDPFRAKDSRDRLHEIEMYTGSGEWDIAFETGLSSRFVAFGDLRPIDLPKLSHRLIQPLGGLTWLVFKEGSRDLLERSKMLESFNFQTYEDVSGEFFRI